MIPEKSKSSQIRHCRIWYNTRQQQQGDLRMTKIENRNGIRTVNVIDFLTGRSDILSGH
jgi:hypothetical protein